MSKVVVGGGRFLFDKEKIYKNVYLITKLIIHEFRLSLSSRILCSLDINIHKNLEQIAINIYESDHVVKIYL